MNPQKYSKRLLGMSNKIMNVEIPEFVQSPKDVANYYPELGDRDRLLKIKDLQEKQNKILSQIKKSKVVEKSNINLG